jgi:4-hydroxy-tetrahydrodipicolinate synthase
MAQYAPEQTGVAIKPKVFADLFKEVPNINHYKIECKPFGVYISTLKNETGNKAVIFIGNAGYQFIEGLDRGAVGVMPGCSMFDIYLRVYNEYVEGNRTRAQEFHSAYILPMLNHIRQDVEMIIVYEKKILKKRGIIAGDYCRQPGFSGDSMHDKIFEEHYERIVPLFTPI